MSSPGPLDPALSAWDAQLAAGGVVQADLGRTVVLRAVGRVAVLVFVLVFSLGAAIVVHAVLGAVVAVVIALVLPGLAWSALDVAESARPAIVVDPGGVLLAQRLPLRLSWDDVVDGVVVRTAARGTRRRLTGFLVLTPDAAAAHRARQPAALRWSLRLVRLLDPQDAVALRGLRGVSSAQLAGLLDALADRHLGVPPHLVLRPDAAGRVVRSARSGRDVPLARLAVGDRLAADVLGWNARLGPPDEGRTLAVHLDAVLEGRATVRYWQDPPPAA